MSAQQVASINAAHSNTKRAVNQVVQLTKEEAWRLNSDARLRQQMERLPYSAYDANTVDPSAKKDVVDEHDNPLGQERYVIGHLWVFASTLNDAFGTRKYWVYNTKTQVLVSFEPEHGIAAKNRTYMPANAQFRNMAAGTGVVGGYMEKGFLGVSAGMLTGGLIYEIGGVAVVGTAIRAYLVKTAKGAGTRILVDLTTQFGVGAVTGKGSWSQRAQASFMDINWVSALGAAAVNTEGLRWHAKLLAAFGTSVGSNAYSFKFNNEEKYHSPGHMVNINDAKESKDFVINVILGTVFDQAKEYGAPWLEKVMRSTPNTMGMLTALKHRRVVPRLSASKVDQSMVAVLSYHMGGAMETIKKGVENYFADKQEQQEAAKKAALRKKTAARPSKP
ncbi:hypothetical protein GCM10022409_09210 [Hymenobacter glaciei]|uniref:Uncharacterized protein n=1 Tax=Hymenobacter glaciei TaxID=877209 RepID=A0ABP7TLK4_9BACT